jgi:hypothetical protein
VPSPDGIFFPKSVERPRSGPVTVARQLSRDRNLSDINPGARPREQETGMYRAIIVLLIVCALSLYVRHQFQTVIHQMTTQVCPTCNGTGWVDNPVFGR